MAASGVSSGPSIWQPRWILGAWQDLLLFVATPLVILPLLPVVQRGLSDLQIALYVAAFGALGHHLPGMIRAYGDRELFARFRTRFVVSPVFLLAVCIGSSLHLPHALTLIVTLWGTWHGLAQVYGFARIYDAKVTQVSWLTHRLDLWMCVAWFGAGLLFSPGRTAELLGTYYAAGGVLLAPEWIVAAKSVWAMGTAVITAAFLANLVAEARRGRPASLVKLLLFASSFGFWWYAMVSIQNVVIGIAIFEIFHDVQYLAIVWGYNRKRVDGGSEVSGFLRFLFRRSGLLIGVYVGLVFAYGATRLVTYEIEQKLVQDVLLGVIAASTLLHFYFDAFIWSVRDASTRAGLGLDGQGASVSPRQALAQYAPQAAKWGLFVAPLVVLGWVGAAGTDTQLERYASVVAAAPESASARVDYALALEAEGRDRDAVAHLKEAVRVEPRNVYALTNLGLVYMRRQQTQSARDTLERAVALDPGVAGAQQGLGRMALARDDFVEAQAFFEAASASEPRVAAHRYLVGVATLAQGRHEAAAEHFERALALGAKEIGSTPGARVVFARLAAAYEAAGEAEVAAHWRTVASTAARED